MYNHPTINSYQQAFDFLQKGRDKLSRNLHGRSTVIEAQSDYSEIYIRYHSTRIITYYPDGSIKLNGNGYRTSTTKIKLNEYAPNNIQVSQKAGIWYLCVRSGEDATSYIFADNVTIDPDGSVMGAASNEDEKASKKLITKINKYTADYIDSFLDGNVNSPTGADCWFCVMQTQDGKSLGESTGSTNHIVEHMKEKYYPGSLLANAMNADNMPVSQAMRWGLGEIWGDKEPGHFAEMCKQQYVNVLRKYIKRQFSLASH